MLRKKGYRSGELVPLKTSTIIDEITAGRPIYADGRTLATPEAKSAGHSWVIDGYIIQFHSVQVTDYLSWDNSTRKLTQIGQRVSANNSIPVATKDQYWHCNWGWSGKNNGYFIDFNTAAGMFDSDINPSIHVLNESKKFIYNIKY